MALDREIEVFRSKLGELLGEGDANEGEYVAIKVDEEGMDHVIGPFPGREEALTEAYETFGLGGFLVKKLERVESVVRFTRIVG